MDDVRYQELIERAQYYGNQSNWDKCIEYYQKAFEIMVRVDDLLDLSIVYLQIDNSFLALKGIDSVIEILPDDFRGYFYKGIYYEHIEDDLEALKYYLKSLELEKNVPEIYFKIGRIYDDLSDNENKLENIELAKEYYYKTLELDDNHYYANLNLGSMYERDNNLEEALKFTLKSYSVNKDEKMASYNLGVIYSKLNDFEKAKECYLEEITKKDFYPYAYYNLGIIYKDEDKDYLKAKEYYLKGLNYLKKDPSLWYNLGCVHVLTNDYSNAYDCFYCAISINEKILNYIELDQEIKDFLKTEYYEKLRNVFKKRCSKFIKCDIIN